MKKKPAYIAERIPEHSTVRTCGPCINEYHPRLAEFFKYRIGQDGSLDKSSRQPVCEEHAG